MTRLLRTEIKEHVNHGKYLEHLFEGLTRWSISRQKIVKSYQSPTPAEQIEIVHLLALDQALPEEVLYQQLFRMCWRNNDLLKKIVEGLRTRALRSYFAYWQAGLAHLGFLRLWLAYQGEQSFVPKWHYSQSRCLKDSLRDFNLLKELPTIKNYGLANEVAFSALQSSHSNPYQPWAWLLNWFKTFNPAKKRLSFRNHGGKTRVSIDLMAVFLQDLLQINAFPEPAKILCYYIFSVLALLKGDVAYAKQIVITYIPADPELPEEVLRHSMALLQSLSDPSRQSKAQLLAATSPLQVKYSAELNSTIPISDVTFDHEAVEHKHEPNDDSACLTHITSGHPIVKTESASTFSSDHLATLLKSLQFFCAFARTHDISAAIENNFLMDPLLTIQRFAPTVTQLPDAEKEPDRWEIYMKTLTELLHDLECVDHLIKHQIHIFNPPDATSLQKDLKTSFERLEHVLAVKFSTSYIPGLLRAEPLELKAQQLHLRKDLQIINHILPAMMNAFNQAQQLIMQQQQLLEARPIRTQQEENLKISLIDLENTLLRELNDQHIPRLLRAIDENESVDTLEQEIKTALLTTVLDWPVQMLEKEAMRLKAACLTTESATTSASIPKTTDSKENKSDFAAGSTAATLSLPSIHPKSQMAITPRRAAISSLRQAQQAIRNINQEFLNNTITAQQHQQQVKRYLKESGQGLAGEHQALTRPLLILANILIVVCFPLHYALRPSIRKNNGTVYSGWRGCFFSLEPKRVVNVKQVESLIIPVSSEFKC